MRLRPRATVEPLPKAITSKVPRILRIRTARCLARRTAPRLDQALEGTAQLGVLELRQLNCAPRRARHRAQPRAGGAAAKPALHEAQVPHRIVADARGQPRENFR